MTNLTKSQKVLVFGSIILLLFGIGYMIHKINESKESPLLSFFVYQVEGGWGYDIKLDNRTIIHQPFVPVIQNSQPFPSFKSAESTAKIVMKKVSKGDTPSLSKEELLITVPELFAIPAD